MQSGTRLRIPTSTLLRSSERTLALADLLKMKHVVDSASAPPEGGGGLANLAIVSEDELRAVHATYGEGGLFRLFYLAMTNEVGEFAHFFDLIRHQDRLLEAFATEEVELRCDNDALPQGADLRRFNSNVVVPSLSRKLYDPGRHPGYLVYGLGGPKILVSHPFRGIDGELHDVYDSSLDLTTRLITRGYHGTFLFQDNLPGPKGDVGGVPAWLLWFSLIAAHSDVVVFVKEDDHGFSASQQREIAYTPDRVQKKIVEIPHDELAWARRPEDGGSREHRHVGAEGIAAKAAYDAAEAEQSRPLLEAYARPGFPKDRLIRIGETDEVTEYPLDHPAYQRDQLAGP